MGLTLEYDTLLPERATEWPEPPTAPAQDPDPLRIPREKRPGSERPPFGVVSRAVDKVRETVDAIVRGVQANPEFHRLRVEDEREAEIIRRMRDHDAVCAAEREAERQRGRDQHLPTLAEAQAALDRALTDERDLNKRLAAADAEVKRTEAEHTRRLNERCDAEDAVKRLRGEHARTVEEEARAFRAGDAPGADPGILAAAIAREERRVVVLREQEEAASGPMGEAWKQHNAITAEKPAVKAAISAARFCVAAAPMVARLVAELRPLLACAEQDCTSRTHAGRFRARLLADLSSLLPDLRGLG